MRKQNNFKKNIEFIFLAILVLLLINNISALGIASSYNTGERPFNVYAGEENLVYMNLMSSTSDSNQGIINVRAEITDGKEIASIDGPLSYDISPTKYGTVKINIKVPENAPLGTEYFITLKSSPTEQVASSGMVGLSVTTSFTFKAVVVENPNKPLEPVATPTPEIIEEKPVTGSNTTVWLIITLIIIIAIMVVIFFILKNKKRK